MNPASNVVCSLCYQHRVVLLPNTVMRFLCTNQSGDRIQHAGVSLHELEDVRLTTLQVSAVFLL